MPELPEVESVVRSLAKQVTGDIIESAWFSEKPQTFKCSPQQIAAAIEKTRIERVHRQGKHIIIDLASLNGVTSVAQWIVHLGMTGKMLVTRPGLEIEKHTHVIAALRSGREIRFVDPRRFGRTWVVTDDSRFEAGGLEPLDISFEDFVRMFRGRKTPIKSALLNQKLLRGVGNIYADESLFRAGIRPRRSAASLTRKDFQKLYQSVQQVLRQAIAAGGSSVSDYVDAEGSRGFFQIQHRVYGREGESCVVCGTPIKRIVVAGRGTHYCPKCQK